jgi:nephrocystin-3
MQEKSKAITQPRVIRVFVSSTFRDMFEERDELVKRVFPQLRKMCEQRGVTWGEVDLRWGIPDEQKAEGKVLPICLAEIQRCRPYFIGLLGERYGWIPDEIPEELIEQEPWLKEHLTHSVTELEILHGVLNNPKMADHAFFYFRDPAYVDSLPANKRKDFTSESSGTAEKLKKLKERIRQSGLPVRENYKNPKALGELVLKDLTQIIDQLYPIESKPDPLERDAADHEAFAQSRARVYIGREEYFKRLDEHAKGDSQPLVILGESGSGKSALLANWVIKYREAHLNELLIMHFIGASPYSSDWAAMLRRIMGEFKRRFDIKGEIPDKPDELRNAFANWLSMAAVKGKVIIILDALNQLEDRDGAPDLVWLPPSIPTNVRMFLSTLPGRPLDDLKKRSWPVLTVEALSLDERRQFIWDCLKKLYSKELPKDQAKSIADAEQSANPLFLQSLLEELRLFGEHERLPKRIKYYLEAKTIPELYEKILSRYEEDYERDRPGLVKDAMTYIWAARRGLSEAELMDLLGSDGNPLPRAIWSPLYLAAEQSLVSRSGLIGFFHDFLREAVKNRYLPKEKEQEAIHLHLAGYFATQELGFRVIDELLWQVAKVKSWQILYNLLADLDFFELAWRINKFDVKGYWAQIETSSNLRMVDAYHSVLKAPKQIPDPNQVWYVGVMLADTGHPEESLLLRKYLVEHYRRTKDWNNLQSSLANQAVILFKRGDLDGSMKLLKEQERICRELGDKDGLSTFFNEQANILYARGELDEAMKLHKENEQIYRELGNKDGLSISLGNQAVILQARGDLDGSMKLLKEQERICRELGDKDGLSTFFNEQANILYARGDLDGAMKLHKEKERICRELGNKDGLGVSLGNQALILIARGDLDGSMKLLKEQERICRELGDKDGLSTFFNEQANILNILGDIDGAMKLYKEQERICRELGNKNVLQALLVGQALILKTRNDLDGAMKLLKEAESICRELGNKDGLSISLGNQANILAVQGDLDGAMKLYKEEEGYCRELGNKNRLWWSINNQAMIINNRGDLDGALKLHKEAEQICRELGNKDGLSISLGNQANILYALGDIGGAMKLFREVERICRELGNRTGIATSLTNQASVLSQMGRGHEALSLVEEAYRLAVQYGLIALTNQIKPILDSIKSKIELRKKQGLTEYEFNIKNAQQRAFINKANILYEQGDLDGALKLYKKQERICRELGNKDGLWRSLYNQARLLLFSKNEPNKALSLCQEAIQILEQIGTAPDFLKQAKTMLAESYANQAMILQARSDIDGAMKLLKEQERICRELGNPDGLVISLANQALVLAQNGKIREALQLAEEAYQLASRHGLTALVDKIKPILDDIRSKLS